jgi:4-amino-4-deoxychorismate lyase
MTILVNGNETEQLSAADRGLQYGDGVFESIAVRDGLPLLWERHFTRLTEGCRRLMIPVPDCATLRRELGKVAGAETRAVVKVIVTRGDSGRGYRPGAGTTPTRIVRRYPWPDYPADNARIGVELCWCRMRLSRQPLLAGLKHLNRLEQVVARGEWQDEYADGLMRDTEGRVIEGTMSNLFLVHEDVLVTPDLSESGVAGVMRAEVLAQAMRHGITTRISPVTVAMVETAKELFLTNSLIGIWPVARLEMKQYVVGKTTQTLQAALQAANITA